MKTLFLTICLITAGFSTEAFAARDTEAACKARAQKKYDLQMAILEKERISDEERGALSQHYTVEFQIKKDTCALLGKKHHRRQDDNASNPARAQAKEDTSWTCAEDAQCQEDKIDAMSGAHSGSGY
jgi:hypothetical protein